MIDRARVEFDHNRLLKKVANGVFAPLGLVQRGSSRVWFDDHVWWVITVSFDASGSGKGAYLRVGTSPLWTPGDIIGFVPEGRDGWAHPHANFEMKFIRARRPDWWERDVGIFAEGAAEYVRELRAKWRDGRTLPDLERDALGDRGAFLHLVAENVARTRESEKLPPIPIETIVRVLDAASHLRS